MKQCVVVGVGRFGGALLENLSKMNQQVLVIDSDEKTIQMVNDNHLATYAVVADAMDEQVMRSLLGVKEGKKCDYEVGIVCIGENIEASILVSVILKELGVEKVIAKVTNDLHGKVLEKILNTAPKGPDSRPESTDKVYDEVIYPYKDIAELVAVKLVRPNIQEEINLSADYKFMRLSPPKNVVGRSIIQLDLRRKYDINIIGIKPARSEKVDFSVKPDTTIKSDDTLLAIVPNKVVDQFLKEA